MEAAERIKELQEAFSEWVLQRAATEGVAPAEVGFQLVPSDDGTRYALQMKTHGESTSYSVKHPVEGDALGGGGVGASTAGKPPTRRPSSGWLLHMIVMLLPGPDRQRWLEEWRGELYDLRADGEPWWRRAAYVADIVLRGAPRQAVTLRRQGRRAVE